MYASAVNVDVLNSPALSDGTATLSCDSLISSLGVSASTITDRSASMTGGTVTASSYGNKVLSSTLTDGSASISGGTVTSSSYGNKVLLSTLTDGSASMTGSTVTASSFGNKVLSSTLTDGSAMMTSGSLTGVVQLSLAGSSSGNVTVNPFPLQVLGSSRFLYRLVRIDKC